MYSSEQHLFDLIILEIIKYLSWPNKLQKLTYSNLLVYLDRIGQCCDW